MTREELAKAAQGKLTFEELAEIRERSDGSPEVEHARERLNEALDRRSRATELASGDDPGSDVES